MTANLLRLGNMTLGSDVFNSWVISSQVGSCFSSSIGCNDTALLLRFSFFSMYYVMRDIVIGKYFKFILAMAPM